MAVHQLLDELDALVLEQLHVPLLPPVERHRDSPGPREDVGILDRGFVTQEVGTGGCVAFDDVQRVAVVVSGTVEPGGVVEALHVDDQRLTSQRPMDHPIHESAGGSSLLFMYTVRLTLANSYASGMCVGVWTIWNGYGM